MEFNKIMEIFTTLVGGTVPISHGVVTKYKIWHKGLANTVFKRLHNNAIILTTDQILLHQKGGG